MERLTLILIHMPTLCVLGSNALEVETPYPEWTAIVSFADPSVGTVATPI